MKKLTPKQKAFCREYIIDSNATQAAIRAGYSEKTAYSQGQRLLKNVEVQKEIKRLLKPIVEKAELTVESVLKDIREAKERCFQHTPVMAYNKDTKQMEETGQYVFDSKGVFKGCELEGKYLKMFTDKIEHSHKGLGSLTDEDTALIQAEIQAEIEEEEKVNKKNKK